MSLCPTEGQCQQVWVYSLLLLRASKAKQWVEFLFGTSGGFLKAHEVFIYGSVEFWEYCVTAESRFSLRNTYFFFIIFDILLKFLEEGRIHHRILISPLIIWKILEVKYTFFEILRILELHLIKLCLFWHLPVYFGRTEILIEGISSK